MSAIGWIVAAAGCVLTVGGIWLFVDQHVHEKRELTADERGDPALFLGDLVSVFAVIIGVVMVLGATGVLHN